MCIKNYVIWSATDKIFGDFRSFLSFYPSNKPENQNFEIMKKTPGDIIISDLCATNDDHDQFMPFYPPNNPKNQNSAKMKKMPGHIII